MKIIRLNAENFKRLVAVEITPTGNVVEITGKNGQGKSSILDAIYVTLAGMSAAPAKPIRKGELESKIVLTLGTDKPEIVVTRTFKPSKDGTEITTSLKVESADGAKFNSPQDMLNKLLGKLAFDPLEFDRLSPSEQCGVLQSFVKDFDFAANEAAQRGDYDRRTLQNRLAREKRAAAAAIKVDEALANTALVDEAALVAKLEQAGTHNTDIETRKANRARYVAQIEANGRSNNEAIARIAEWMKQIEQTRAVVQEREKESAALQARLDAAGDLPQSIDTAVIRGEIANAQRNNESIRAEQRKRIERTKLVEDAAACETKAHELTESIDMREIKRREAITNAKLPIDGILFGDNEVTLNGLPWAQASTAERLRASISMAMAMNPKLRVIRVQHGNDLDHDSMKLLADLAKAQDYQVWIERVDGTGKVGVVIEDGRVVTSPDKPDTI